MPDSIDERIEADAIEGIASVTVAGQTTASKSIDELIKADTHIANKQVAANGGAGVYIQRQVRHYE